MTGDPRCALCGRTGLRVTRHHLVPQCRTRKNKRKRKELAPMEGQVVDLCRPCHVMIHAVLTEKEIERDYPTLDKLREQPDLRKFAEWVSKQDPNRHITVRWTRDRHLRDG